MPDDQQQQKNEMLIRDADGTFKVWRDGQLVSVDQPEQGVRLKMPSQTTRVVPPAPLPSHTAQDDEEISALKATMGHLLTHNDDVEKDARRILRDSGVALTNTDLEKRLFTALVARLRDLRDDGETRALFQRSVAQGGLGLDSLTIEKIFRSLKRPSGQPQPERETRERPLPPPLPLPPPAPKPVQKQPIQQSPLPRVTPPAPVMREQKKPLPHPTVPPVPLAEPHSRPATTPAGKPRVADVLEPHVLTGPVEELRYRLVDFRRLASQPTDAVKKIEEKLQLLETESFADRISGIFAWRGSEVYDLYLTITEESVLSGKPVTEIIRQKTNEKKPTLTEEEYRAVVWLNRQLKF